MKRKRFIFILSSILFLTTANLAFADLFDYGVNQPKITYTSSQWGNYMPHYNPYSYYPRPYCPYNYVPPNFINSNVNTSTTTTTDNDGTKKIITTTPIYGNPYYNPYWRRAYSPYYYPNNTTSNVGVNILRSLVGFN